MTVATDFTRLASNTGGQIAKSDISSAVKSYEEYHACYGGEEVQRKSKYADMVNKYYDLATSFYEYGWGQSFHFAHRLSTETLQESIKRHEHFLALRLNLRPGMKVLDVGCGIGGPLREIASFRRRFSHPCISSWCASLMHNISRVSRGLLLCEERIQVFISEQQFEGAAFSRSQEIKTSFL
ncbi:hypothetical protein KP509_18G025100 [Ceratopteris richardii]|uniref:SAM-dependent methyltransferase Erg6/SMT-type domain-containing protein n=1 Tax=Ceratopteris richardii TaxID=49495 RepID=A0A8T2SQD3_CERRI|nr:hypothetical protein KP509_18G025100 [Ceratopteris richardii]